jgi:hypothetical protein
VYDTNELNITFGDPSKETDYENKNVAKHRIYTSSGRIVSPIKMAGNSDTVFAYSQTNISEMADGAVVRYNNLLDTEYGLSDRYTYLHYIV